MKLLSPLALLTAVAATVGSALPAQAQERVLNLYSARHYQTDEALYTNFTKSTGIRINRIEMGDEPLLERLRTEGAASPADVVLLVDAARIWRAQQDGLFAPVQSKLLTDRIPADLRAADNTWFAFSSRARVIVYDKSKVKPTEVDTYEKLAAPGNKDKLCIRSGSHPYNLSLFGSMLERTGEAATTTWLKGLVDNMARQPKGGDTDQIRAVASGECQIAVTNTYYFVRLMKSTKPEDRELVQKVGLIFPNQATSGTHMNISGGAMARNAKNRAEAQAFLEYLASDEAQAYFANGNNEWPVVASAKAANPELASLGDFKRERLSIGTIGRQASAAQRLLDRVGFR
ncbi:iron deficiency-induced protein A [beta proteobacterium AAP99]|nr:iron deficiency-induced protein A [beta proteobacterium AAP99]